MTGFNGLGMNLGNLSRISKAETRSISAENPTGEKGKGGMATEGTGAGCARDLGQGWKVSPSMVIEAGQTYTLADIEGPGAIQSMWLSGDVARTGPLARFYILRIYWDNQEVPSVECPSADFFASGWGQFAQINSLPVSVNPNRGYNCFWEMPFSQGNGALRRDVPGMGRKQQRMVGRRRDQVLHRRRRRVSNDLWHGNRGLLRGSVQLGCERAIRPLLDAVHGDAPGHPSRWRLSIPAPLLHVSLAHRGSDSLREGPEGHDSSPGMARWRAVSASSGRHRIGGVLVSNAADQPLPRVAGRGLSGNHMTAEGGADLFARM